KIPADDEAAGKAQDDHQAGAPEERGLEQVLERAALVHVARDEEIEALRQREHLAARIPELGVGANATLISELDEPIGGGGHLRPSVEIAGNDAAVAVGKEVEPLLSP